MERTAEISSTREKRAGKKRLRKLGKCQRLMQCSTSKQKRRNREICVKRNKKKKGEKSKSTSLNPLWGPLLKREKMTPKNPKSCINFAVLQGGEF